MQSKQCKNSRQKLRKYIFCPQKVNNHLIWPYNTCTLSVSQQQHQETLLRQITTFTFLFSLWQLHSREALTLLYYCLPDLYLYFVWRHCISNRRAEKIYRSSFFSGTGHTALFTSSICHHIEYLVSNTSLPPIFLETRGTPSHQI